MEVCESLRPDTFIRQAVHAGRELSPALKALLGVDALWCDTRSEAASQKFVLWAGAVLEQRQVFDRVLGGRRFTFSVLVHSDAASALVDFLAASSVLQVSRSQLLNARMEAYSAQL